MMPNVNSLALGNLNEILDVIFKHILVIDGWGISCETALIWMSLDFADDKSTLVQVMAWCRQATNHYLNQRWPYGITRPQRSQTELTKDTLVGELWGVYGENWPQDNIVEIFILHICIYS